MNKIRGFVPIVVMLLISVAFSQYSFGLEGSGGGEATIDDAERYIVTKEYPKAAAIFETFISSPDLDLQRNSLYGLGRVYYFQGDSSNARKNLEAALAVKQEGGLSQESPMTHTLAGIYVYLSYIAMQHGNYDNAILKLKKAIDAGLADVNMNSTIGSNIYTLIAKNYLNKGDTAAAKIYLNKSLALKLGNPTLAAHIRQMSLVEMGRCDLLSGDYTKAIGYFDSAIASRQENNNYMLAAYIGNANAYLLSGQSKKALTQCADKLESLPAGVLRSSALYTLGAIYSKNGDPAKAEDFFKRAITTTDGFGKTFRRSNYSHNYDLDLALAHYGLGVIYEAGNRHDQALSEMKKTVELTKSLNPEVFTGKVTAAYLRIAAQQGVCDILTAKGKKDEAMKESQILQTYISGLSSKEKEMIGKKYLGIYIEGKLRL